VTTRLSSAANTPGGVVSEVFRIIGKSTLG
jgi:hypothetical protein